MKLVQQLIQLLRVRVLIIDRGYNDTTDLMKSTREVAAYLDSCVFESGASYYEN